jgi:acyl-CoA synthetase (AMP-forming)/AMP-acid ligase II
VVPVDGTNVNERDVLEYCRKRLETYKIPKELVIVSRLPRTSAGKINYKELRRIKRDE